MRGTGDGVRPLGARPAPPRPSSRKVSSRERGGTFGRDPEAYDRARLPYPDRVYEVLVDRCGLGPGTVTFEIGPGTGIATRELLRRGARPLTLIEPDRRLVRFLRSHLPYRPGEVSFRPGRFEEVPLPSAHFDLGVAATSFHWLPQARALRKVARALRPGGWWATWGNVHGDPFRPRPFLDALQPLYRQLYGPRSRRRGPVQEEADERRQLEALRATGHFDRIRLEALHWDVELPSERVQALWGSFSEILVLPYRRRRWFLTELGRVVEEGFSGRVPIPILTPLYTARRR